MARHVDCTTTLLHLFHHTLQGLIASCDIGDGIEFAFEAELHGSLQTHRTMFRVRPSDGRPGNLGEQSKRRASSSDAPGQSTSPGRPRSPSANRTAGYPVEAARANKRSFRRKPTDAQTGLRPPQTGALKDLRTVHQAPLARCGFPTLRSGLRRGPGSGRHCERC